MHSGRSLSPGIQKDYIGPLGKIRVIGSTGIMNKKMETTIMGYIGFRVSGLKSFKNLT